MYSSSIGRNNISRALKHLVNTYVVFEQAKAQAASIKIYTPYGQLVAELLATDEKTVWDTRHFPAGTYIFTLKSNAYNKSGKIVISK